MTFRQRAIGAAKLDIAVFEEIEADRHATRQALAMVVLSSAAAGVGLSSSVYDAPVLTRVVLALLLWVFWAALTYAIGLYLLPEPQTETDVGELLQDDRVRGLAGHIARLRIGPRCRTDSVWLRDRLDARRDDHRRSGRRSTTNQPRVPLLFASSRGSLPSRWRPSSADCYLSWLTKFSPEVRSL